MLHSELVQSVKKFLILTLIVSMIVAPNAGYAQSSFVAALPEPGAMLSTSNAFTPLLVKGLIVHPDKPLNFDFIVDSGNDAVDQTVVQEQSMRIAKYFLAALTVPEDQLWVNLSPYEKDRIIENDLGLTMLGRDMLAQDYILKQLTASLIYPEQGLGKDFWDKVYAQAQEKFGTTDIPVDTFNKVWIMPERAEVYEKGNAVYVTEAKLKVLLDTDYTAINNDLMPTRGHIAESQADSTKNGYVSPSTLPNDQLTNAKATQELANQFLREIILPAIEKEINEGKNFAVIRQVYHAAILAKWYRELIQNTLLSDAFVGSNLVTGVTSDEGTLKEEIYQRYIAAYKKGVFDYIKEVPSSDNGENLPRKYFSGGISDFAMKALPLVKTDKVQKVGPVVGSMFKVGIEMNTLSDAAMLNWFRWTLNSDVQLMERSWKRSILLLKLAGMAGKGSLSVEFLTDKSFKWIQSSNIEKKVTGLNILGRLFQMKRISYSRALSDSIEKIFLYDNSPAVKLAALSFYESMNSIPNPLRFLAPADVKKVTDLQSAFKSQKQASQHDYVKRGVYLDVNKRLDSLGSHHNVLKYVISKVDGLDFAQTDLIDIIDLEMTQESFSGLSINTRQVVLPDAAMMTFGQVLLLGTSVILSMKVLVWFLNRHSFKVPPKKFDGFIVGGADKRVAAMLEILEKTTDRWGVIKAVAFIASQPSANGSLPALRNLARNSSDVVVAAYAKECLGNIARFHTDLLIRHNASKFLNRLDENNHVVRSIPVEVLQIEGPDRAQNGGINIQDINVARGAGGVKIQFDDQVFRNAFKDGFNGFAPVIINIQPVQGPLMLLGAI